MANVKHHGCRCDQSEWSSPNNAAFSSDRSSLTLISAAGVAIGIEIVKPPIGTLQLRHLPLNMAFNQV